MTTQEIRETLRQPWLLNLVSGLFALERIYANIGSTKIALAGHFWIVLLYMVGFGLGVADDAIKSHSKKSSSLYNFIEPHDWVYWVSWGVFLVASALLLIFLYGDLHTQCKGLDVASDCGCWLPF